MPDGRHVLFTLFGGKGLADAKVGVVDLQTARVQALFPGSLATYVSTGHIVYFHLGGYHAVPFDAATLTVTGAARPVLEDARPLDPLADAESYVDVARDGRLAYVPGRATRSGPYAHLAWIDRHGRTERLPFADNLGHSALSPDQRHVAVSRFAAGDIQVWIYVSSAARATSYARRFDFDPRWSPSGDRVAFTSLLTGSFDLRTSAPDGARPPEVLLATEDDDSKWVWLPDGRSGVFQSWGPTTGQDIQAMAVGDPADAGLSPARPRGDRSQVSPDGQLAGLVSGRPVYVARYPEMTGRVQVAVGASTAMWAHGRTRFSSRSTGRCTSCHGRSGHPGSPPGPRPRSSRSRTGRAGSGTRSRPTTPASFFSKTIRRANRRRRSG